jgi:hypothetical protein
MAEEHGRWVAHTFDSLKHAMMVLLNHLRIESELSVLIFGGKKIGNRQLSVTIFQYATHRVERFDC